MKLFDSLKKELADSVKVMKGEFIKCDGKPIQAFIDNKLERCPMCHEQPDWRISEALAFPITRSKFKCSACGAILSAEVTDINAVLSVWSGAFLIKKLAGKDAFKLYLKVENIGNAQLTTTHENKEYPVEELQMMIQE